MSWSNHGQAVNQRQLPHFATCSPIFERRMRTLALGLVKAYADLNDEPSSDDGDSCRGHHTCLVHNRAHASGETPSFDNLCPNSFDRGGPLRYDRRGPAAELCKSRFFKPSTIEKYWGAICRVVKNGPPCFLDKRAALRSRRENDQ